MPPWRAIRIGDGNIYNDRLPEYIRNAFVGPDYFSTDMRITRTIRCGERVHLESDGGIVQPFQPHQQPRTDQR